MDQSALRLKPSDWPLLGVLGLLFGTTFFYFEISLTAWQPLTIVAMRLVIAASLLWLVVLFLGLPLPTDRKTWVTMPIVGLLSFVLPWSCMVWALQEINSGTAGIINGTMPLFVLLFAHFLTTDERLSRRKAAAVLIGIGGVCLMIGPSAVRDLDPTTTGQLVFLSTSAVLALGLIWGRRLKHLHPLVTATGTITCGALLAVPAALLVDGVPAALPPLRAGLAMLCLAVLSTVCAYTLQFTMLKRVGACNLVLVNFLVPAVALTFGTLVLGEAFSGSAVLGLASVAIALTLADGRLLASWLAKRPGGAPSTILTQPVDSLQRKAESQ